MRTVLYVRRDSPLHTLDPRTKLACLAAGSAALLLFDDPVFLLGPAAALVALSLVGRVGGRFLAGALLLSAFGMLTFLIWPVFLSLRGQGGAAAWVYGAGMGLRLVEIVLCGYLLMLTTSTEEVLAGFSGLGVPYPAVFALGLTFRLIPSLLATAGHVVEAQRLRGLRFDEGGLLTRARRYVPLLVPILACSLRTANQMSWALEAKGFGAGGRRVSYLVLRLRAADWTALALAAAVLTAAVFARLSGVGLIEAARHF